MHNWARLLPGLLLISMTVLPASAEISIQSSSGHVDLLHIFGKTSDPDPLPHFALVRFTPLVYALNPEGDSNGDRWADLVYRVGSPPAVVWSHWDGSDYEIAYSEWNGAVWTPAVLLTDNALDDVHPRIALDLQCRPVVTWWRSGVDSAVYSARRVSGGAWEAENRISTSGEPARNATVAVPPDGHARYGYETTGGSLRHVIVSRDQRVEPDDPPGVTPEIIATTQYAEDTNAVVETRGSRTWVTWVHDATNVGWSQMSGGSWTVPAFEPYSGPEDIEAARFRIRNRMSP